MKLLIIFSIILSFFYCKITLGQNKIYYHKNIFEATFTKCENPPIFGKDSIDLQKYLSEKLQSQILKTTGTIDVSLLIDKTGKISCESILNNSNLNLKKTQLNLLFDSMPNWTGAVQNGHQVNSTELIILTFNKETLEVSNRIGIK